MQDGCKVYMDFCMASNGSWFMVTWIIFKNHLMEVDLTQNQETVALRNAHNHLVFSILSCVRMRMNRIFIGIAFGWGPGHIRLHASLEGPWPHYMILEVVLERPLDTFFTALTTPWSQLLAISEAVLERPLDTFPFGLSQFHGHGSWLVCAVALSWNVNISGSMLGSFALGCWSHQPKP